MCGIAGAIGPNADGIVGPMTAVLRHRGPDAVGFASCGNAYLGSRRLSIIDLADGAQPLRNEDGRLKLVFNGEIYNHRSLRRQLEQRGHTFATQSDGEVILHLYEEEGPDCVHALHGMFAFAVLDGTHLLLARDRLGIKPLYYATAREGRLFVFASEIKALLRSGVISPQLDLQSFADTLVLGHPVGTDTFFQGVKSLAPGHHLAVESEPTLRVGQPCRYYAGPDERDSPLSFDEACEAVEHALRSAVGSHLAADVEVALTLSGGLDSSLLALIARDLLGPEAPLRTFVVSDSEGHPDAMQAGALARSVGTDHRDIRMDFEDYLATVPRCAEAEETPSSLTGVPYHFLCERIRREVKACLHGEGADELFGGYHEYLDLYAWVDVVRQRLPALRRLGIEPSARVAETVQRVTATSTIEEHVRVMLDTNMGDQLERYHLTPVDKSAMASGLEMRVPYLDDEFVALVTRLPAQYLVRADIGVRKYLLRRLALDRYGPQTTDIVLRSKHGLPSAGAHFMQRFDRLCETVLPDDYLQGHELGRCFNHKRELLMFELFAEIFFVHRGDSAAVGPIQDFIDSRASRPVSAVTGS
jgi:asparagine synthase (glutamine-hydrolysing)